MSVVLPHEAWVWGIGFDKDASWETPPARAPASTQLIVLRVWVRLPYLIRRSAELVSSPPVIATPIPHTHTSSRDILNLFDKQRYVGDYLYVLPLYLVPRWQS